MAMMGWMRRSSRWFLLAVVFFFVASLAYFGATGDRSAPVWVARVNGEEISAAAYERAYRSTVERLRQAFRERYNEELLRTLRVQEQVVEQLVTERLLAQRAKADGLATSDEELRAEIARIPAFHDGGRFSREQYVRVLARAQLSPGAFEADVRADLLRRKFEGLVRDGVRVTEAELRQLWESRRARVEAAYLFVPTEPYLASVPVAEADLGAYHKDHPAQFTRPERRRVLMATIPTASVPAPTITDADLEAAYEERRREFEQPARVRVAHILVRVPTVGGSEAEDRARARAEAALQRIRGGADFAQVAREVSEDPATAAKGGELGLMARGEMVAPFEQAAFALKVGELGGPVRTPFGYHVIKTLEVVAGSKQELREVAPTLRATLVAEGQLRALRDRAQEIQEALKGAADFAAEARRRGLPLQELGPFGRADAVEGVGRVREATDAIFALVPDGVSPAIKVPEGYTVFRLLERQEARPLALEEVRGEVEPAVRRQKAQAAAEKKAAELKIAWQAGEDPRALAKREGVSFGETGAFSRAEPMADRELGGVIGTPALELAQGTLGGPVSGPKGVYVLRVLSRRPPDPGTFDAARAELERELMERKRGQAWQGWLAALRAQAKGIEINRKVLPPG